MSLCKILKRKECRRDYRGLRQIQQAFCPSLRDLLVLDLFSRGLGLSNCWFSHPEICRTSKEHSKRDIFFHICPRLFHFVFVLEEMLRAGSRVLPREKGEDGFEVLNTPLPYREQNQKPTCDLVGVIIFLSLCRAAMTEHSFTTKG